MATIDKFNINGTNYDLRDNSKVLLDQGIAQVGNALVVGEDGFVTTGEAGIPDAVKVSLLELVRHVAYIDDQGQAYYDALYAALYGAAPVVTYSTVIYADGAMYFNEPSTQRNAHIAEHGAVAHEYAPMDEDNPYVFEESSAPSSTAPWFAVRETITSVTIASPMKPTSIKGWFTAMSNCLTFDLANLDTSECTSMIRQFINCAAVTHIDLSGFNTTNMTNMNGVFLGCTALRTIAGLDKIDTKNATSFSAMFAECANLTTLDLSHFDSGKNTSMNGMFRGNTRLTSVDISSFVTTALTNTNNCFSGCSSLTTIYASNLFDATNVTNSSNMFLECTELRGGSGTTYNASFIDKTRARIDGGTTSPGYFTAKS